MDHLFQLSKKTFTLCFKIPGYLIALFILCLLFLIKKFKKFYLYEIYGDRIGHFIENLQITFISANEKTLFVWLDNKACNFFLKQKVKETFYFWPLGKSLFEKIKKLSLFLNIKNKIFFKPSFNIQKKILGRTWLKLTKKEIHEGEKILELNGIPSTCRIVTFLSRNNNYLKSKNDHPIGIFENEYRNTSANKYLPAIRFLAKKNVVSILINDSPAELQNTKCPLFFRLTDLQERTDFLDIYLGYRCIFAVTASSGWYYVPWIFRKKILLVNHIPISEIPFWHSGTSIFCKRLFLKSQKKHLSLKQVFQYKIQNSLKTSEYKLKKIRIRENSACEILLGVKKMFNPKIVIPTWDDKTKAQYLNYKFKNAVKEKKMLHYFQATVFN